jgi:hypothetical protein
MKISQETPVYTKLDIYICIATTMPISFLAIIRCNQKNDNPEKMATPGTQDEEK